MQPLTYAFNLQVHGYTIGTPFLLLLMLHSPGPASIDSHTPLPTDQNNAANHVVLRQRIPAQPATKCTKVNGSMIQQQTGYMSYFDQRVGSLSDFKDGQMIYVIQPPLTLFWADRQILL